MNTYSKALRHINIKDVKQKHQQKIIEQKLQEEAEEKEREYLKSLMEIKKYDWRKEIERVDNKVEEEVIVNTVDDFGYDWRGEFFRDKRKYFDVENLDEGMTTKDFEYLYGLSISNIQIDSSLGRIQNNSAQEIVQASSEVTDYQFGTSFPGSFINSIGDGQIISQSKVDALAFLDTTYGNVSGSDNRFTLTTGPEGLPPEGQSPPGSVVSTTNLQTALGVTLPAGVPNGNLGGTPIEGSAIKRVFTKAEPGKRINFNWQFASSEDALGAGSVDDYAFVAIKGTVTKFVSVLTKGLTYAGQFIYTVQPEDIVDGKVEIGIGVMDVFDPYVQTALTISNFGTFWAAGSLGSTTDAADLGMSVAAGMPQSQQKKEAEKEKTQQQTKVEKTVAQYQTSLNNFVSELENLEKELQKQSQAPQPTSQDLKLGPQDPDLIQKLRDGKPLSQVEVEKLFPDPSERKDFLNFYNAKNSIDGYISMLDKLKSSPIKGAGGQADYNYYTRPAMLKAHIEEPKAKLQQLEQQFIQKYGYNPSNFAGKPITFDTQKDIKLQQQIADLKAQAAKLKADAKQQEFNAYATASLIVLGAGLLTVAALTSSTAVAVPSAAARVSTALDALKKSADAAKAARAAAARSMGQNSKGTGMGDRWSGPQFNSYEPQGEVISEKSSPKRLKTVQQALYPGQPSPNGFPDTPPPEMVNGYHPDYGQKDNMYNTLDKTSADSMPLTGNGKIDKKIKAARKQSK